MDAQGQVGLGKGQGIPVEGRVRLGENAGPAAHPGVKDLRPDWAGRRRGQTVEDNDGAPAESGQFLTQAGEGTRAQPERGFNAAQFQGGEQRFGPGAADPDRRHLGHPGAQGGQNRGHQPGRRGKARSAGHEHEIQRGLAGRKGEIVAAHPLLAHGQGHACLAFR